MAAGECIRLRHDGSTCVKDARANRFEVIGRKENERAERVLRAERLHARCGRQPVESYLR